jgi:predicted dehydrogenase
MVRASPAGVSAYEAALADGRMDVALVATPPHLHLDLALQALAKGKDVIVEKPAFLRAADCEVVERARARAGRRVLVAENYCYKPLLRVLRSLVASRVVGEPRFVQVNALKSQRSDGWRSDPARAGGGALLEGGIHWIDLIAHLGSPVVAAHGHRPGPAEGPERSMLVVVEYADGGVGTLCHSWETPSPLRGVQLSRIRGTEGSILFESNGLVAAVWGRQRRLIVPGLADPPARADVPGHPGGPARRAPFMTSKGREDLALVEAAYRGRENGPLARAADRTHRRGAHLDLGHVQGQPA